MKKDCLILNVALGLVILTTVLMSVTCGGGNTSSASPSSDPGGVAGSPPPGPAITGVLMWKADVSGKGLYANEGTLTPALVNVNQFGKLGTFQADGLLIAQPLYAANLTIGGGSHNVVILATEHDSVYAVDADNPAAGTLWERHYLDATAGVAPLPDNFGGRTTLGGEVGITGTPFIDSATGVMYFVTTLTRNGVAEQWLRAVDIHTGNDFGPGSVRIQASVTGDGKGSVGGQIAFDPSVQNQRSGLTKVNNSILVAWGSFSDWGVYHGWLMAFDPATLAMQAVFNPTTQAQLDDDAGGPSDYGGGGAFWQGGASPSVDASGNIYLAAADGSFNAETGGNNYGDTLLKLRLSNGSFQLVDWFTPFNAACVDEADLELGSGGTTLLPTDITGGRSLAAIYNKEGRLFLLDADNLGHFNAAGDTQIPQEFMVGADTCAPGIGTSVAEGTGWNRLYGNPSYWNGFLYAGASNAPLKQYQFQNGLLNPAPVAQSPTAYGLRGGNTVVSATGTQNGIVWAYEKSASGRAVLHAYDATQISHELWNSSMNGGRDQMGTGVGFGTPIVVNGKVIAPFDTAVAIYGLLK